jgi:hypothetical protein
MLPATLAVIAAVRDVLAGRMPQVDRVQGLAASGIPFLAVPEEPLPLPKPVPVDLVEILSRHPTAAEAAASAPPIDGQPAPPDLLAHEVPAPPDRRLRVFSFDPLFATELESLGTEVITLCLPWDFADGNRLEPGPVGEYIEVVDYDPASGSFYMPVDLNHPLLLSQDGLPVCESDPRFHQQMAYAVSMATIHEFEAALGRVALWAPYLKRDPATRQVIPSLRIEDEYVRRLRIYPHALREANAFYHPDKKALLLGYFPARGANVGRNLPGGIVFASLSYDIIAHETTHALLDGLHRYFTEPSNADVFAFHEAFADTVALFQHFSHPEVLRDQIAKGRGDVRRQTMLGVLAAQFGEAMGNRGALRQYLGKRDEQGNWVAITPDPALVRQESEPHARGAILVAALFRAFANIYDNRVKDLRHIATGGTGILPDGDLPSDLENRMAQEAAKAARHMLRMSIRALDYIPPVDITFGEYLRALITADYDLVRDDDRRYRVSVVSAFRDWGIYPPEVRSLSVDSLLWRPPEVEAFHHAIDFFNHNGAGGPAANGSNGNGVHNGNWADDWRLRSDRLKAFVQMRQWSDKFHQWLEDHITGNRDRYLGMALGDDAPKSIHRDPRGKPTFEVHSMRPCRRIGPDGQERIDVVVEIVQRRKAFFDPAQQQKLESGALAWEKANQDFFFRGGCTLVIDPATGNVRYCVRKSIVSEERLDQERRFRQGQFGDKTVGAFLAGDGDDANPFGFLHAGA